MVTNGQNMSYSLHILWFFHVDQSVPERHEQRRGDGKARMARIHPWGHKSDNMPL